MSKEKKFNSCVEGDSDQREHRGIPPGTGWGDLPLIKLSQVSFSYRTPQGLLGAVKRVSFRVKEGEFVALLGANGSGKSTLCKLIAGLLVPSEGEINGNLARDEGRPLAGLMLANPEDQLVCPLVEEEIAFGLQNLGVPYSILVERIQESLELLGINPLRRKLTHLLSGGEQQKVVLAALLALQPRCLILDEATSFLDAAQQQLVREAIQRLHKQEGLGIIWSTPSVEEALQAEHVLVLHQGEVVFQGSPQQLLAHGDKTQDWGLLWPDIYCLLDKLKSSNFNVPADLATPMEIAQALTPIKSEKISNSDQTVNRQQTAPVLIKVENLTYQTTFQQTGEKPILNQIDLSIREGDFIGISGHTGCGKSTLLQHLNGLLEPSSGRVCLAGVDIHKSQKHRQGVRRQIGLVFQYPERQFFNSQIEDEIAFAPRQAGMQEAEVEQNTKEALNWLGLDYQQLRKRSPYELSGGEKRKLAIACVLVMKPRILMLDEPTAGLDGHNKRELLKIIRQLQHQLGLTIIMVSHDLPEIINLAEKLLLLHQGEIYWQGSPGQLIGDPGLLTGLGLPMPAIWEFIYQLKQRQERFAPPDLTVNGVYGEIKKYFQQSNSPAE